MSDRYDGLSNMMIAFYRQAGKYGEGEVSYDFIEDLEHYINDCHRALEDLLGSEEARDGAIQAAREANQKDVDEHNNKVLNG